jgi:tetratricopeptide (TPR) repeat protein
LAGEPKSILVRGEPGIGKSRLIQQLLARFSGPGITVMEAFCTPFTTDTPYFPLAEMLRSHLRLNKLSPEVQLQTLAARLSALGLTEQEAVPLFALFLSLEINADSWPILAQLSSIRQRQRTHELLQKALSALSGQAAILIIVEDLHWADASTIELLTFLHQSMISECVFIVCTARLEFHSPWQQLLNVREMLLENLVPFDAERIIRSVASNKAMPPELVRQICERSAGNPLFLEEITLSILSSSCVIEREHTWDLVQSFSTDLVPASMEAALMARLDRIGEAKTLLQIGATLGREFRLDLLAEVACVPLPYAEEALTQLVDAGFLRVAEDDQSVFIFKHALIQDTAYESLLRSTRLQHHARIALVLEESFPDLAKQRPELMAHHLSGAERYAEAAQLWLHAGQSAVDRCAVNEAIDHLNRGLKDLDNLPLGEDRWQIELDLNAALAPVQMAALDWASPLVEQSCQRAIELVHRLGEHDRLFQLLWGLWSNQFVAGNLGRAIDTANQLLQQAIESGQHFHQLSCRNATSYTHFYRGEFAQAIQHADAGLSNFDHELELEICKIFQSSQTIHIQSAKANSLWMQGSQIQACQEMDRLLQLAHNLNHPPSTATALCYQCFFYFYEYDWPKMLKASSQALEICRSEGYAFWRAHAELYQSAALLRLGQGDSTPEDVLKCAHIFRQTQAFVADASTCCLITDAYRRLGRLDEALAETENGLATARRGQIRVMVPEILCCRGDIHRELGNDREAELAFRQAVEEARDQGAVSLELRALTSLIQHRMQTNAAPDLRDELSRAC